MRQTETQVTRVAVVHGNGDEASVFNREEVRFVRHRALHPREVALDALRMADLSCALIIQLGGITAVGHTLALSLSRPLLEGLGECNWPLSDNPGSLPLPPSNGPQPRLSRCPSRSLTVS